MSYIPGYLRETIYDQKTPVGDYSAPLSVEGIREVAYTHILDADDIRTVRNIAVDRDEVWAFDFRGLVTSYYPYYLGSWIPGATRRVNPMEYVNKVGFGSTVADADKSLWGRRMLGSFLEVFFGIVRDESTTEEYESDVRWSASDPNRGRRMCMWSANRDPKTLCQVERMLYGMLRNYGLETVVVNVEGRSMARISVWPLDSNVIISEDDRLLIACDFWGVSNLPLITDGVNRELPYEEVYKERKKLEALGLWTPRMSDVIFDGSGTELMLKTLGGSIPVEVVMPSVGSLPVPPAVEDPVPPVVEDTVPPVVEDTVPPVVEDTVSPVVADSASAVAPKIVETPVPVSLEERRVLRRRERLKRTTKRMRKSAVEEEGEARLRSIIS